MLEVNNISNKIKILLVITLFLILSKVNIAQTAKPHYIIHNGGEVLDVSKYEKALQGINLDQYRFYDKRRTIRFGNNQATIELYSAKELMEIYGKEISSFTLMDNKASEEIEFYYYEKFEVIEPHKFEATHTN